MRTRKLIQGKRWAECYRPLDPPRRRCFRRYTSAWREDLRMCFSNSFVMITVCRQRLRIWLSLARRHTFSLIPPPISVEKVCFSTCSHVIKDREGAYTWPFKLCLSFNFAIVLFFITSEFDRNLLFPQPNSFHQYGRSESSLLLLVQTFMTSSQKCLHQWCFTFLQLNIDSNTVLFRFLKLNSAHSHKDPLYMMQGTFLHLPSPPLPPV